ncbi:hypothetical protein OQZ55_19210 [Bacillus subtilis]|nr:MULTISPECIES: hypothetical protein [Bacillus]AOY04932.1 hypothetical protein BKN48_06185 [Bacillus subtilis]MCO8150078.1 hypothetical protein [Bacillus subtilis]MCT6512006.1 hypothetical protein [Bacillus subtilis]MCX4078309.1 hypothetical protein [Bacillus subtilis]MDY7216052.1 hypothetical protein [Bacillus subtilis]
MSKLKSSIIVILSSFALLVTVLLSTPANTVEAKSIMNNLTSKEKVSEALKHATEADFEKAEKFVKEALKLNDDFTYSVDKEKAKQIGYTGDEIFNLSLFYASIPTEQVKWLEQNKGQEVKVGDASTAIVPALPWVVYIGLQELIALLTAIGLAGIAQQFLKEVYNAGMNKACRKFASKNKYIKSFCKANGYPTE